MNQQAMGTAEDQARRNDFMPPAWKIPWGVFGPNGEWEPNPLLMISASEQLADNVRNGFLPPGAVVPVSKETMRGVTAGGLAGLGALAADQRFYRSTKYTHVSTPTRLQQLDQRIADCHTRRKAAIMRAAQATREV